MFPPHTSTRSNVFVQSNHLLINSKHISLTILCLQHVTVSLPLFTLRLSHYPLTPTFCLHVSPLVHLQARFLPYLVRSSLILNCQLSVLIPPPRYFVSRSPLGLTTHSFSLF